MKEEKHYLDDPAKDWIVTYNGNTFPASFVSARNALRMVMPEINFQANDVEFIIQFANSTDLIAARDSGRAVDINVLNLKRNKRIPGAIIHRKK